MEFLTLNESLTALLWAFVGGGLAAALGILIMRRYVRAARRGETARPPGLKSKVVAGVALSAQTTERLARTLSQKLDQPMWLRQASGRVTWANAAYERLCAANDWTAGGADAQNPELPHHLDCFSANHEGVKRVRAHWDDRDHHFEVSEAETEGAHIFGIANDISARVWAEERLQLFISSLANIFAQVPIGLAIFDERDRLKMFNPALTDLLGLDPAQLARNPEIRDVFEMLREARVMPEERSRRDRKRVVEDIKKAASEQGWQADWVLMDRRTIRVTVRAHPNNSLAFLFENVTKSARLEQKYRREIDQFHATLDRLEEAAAIFTPAGQFQRANQAFYEIWPEARQLAQPNGDVTKITRLCASSCKPNAAWGKLRGFVTGGASRTGWEARFEPLVGGVLRGRFSPLPDGSTLALFSYEHKHSNRKLRMHLDEGRDAPEVIGQAAIRWPDPMPNPAQCHAIRVLGNALVLNDDGPKRQAVRVENVDGKLRLIAPSLPEDTEAVPVSEDPMAFRIFQRVAQSHGLIAEQGPDGAIDLSQMPTAKISKAS